MIKTDWLVEYDTELFLKLIALLFISVILTLYFRRVFIDF